MATVIANTEQLTTEEVDHKHQVTLVVPSTGDATRLREFTEKVKQIFAVGALGTTGSWEETLVTFETDKTTNTTDILNKLGSMPGVEKAEEKRIKNHKANQKGILVILAS